MYVNTYVIGVPESAREQYTAIAQTYAEVASEFGALEIFENWECEVPDGKLTDYRRAVRAEPGEKIVLSWVVWPDRETAARAHREMFEDARLVELGDMPFDGKRMILGGFEPLLVYHAAEKT